MQYAQYDVERNHNRKVSTWLLHVRLEKLQILKPNKIGIYKINDLNIGLDTGLTCLLNHG